MNPFTRYKAAYDRAALKPTGQGGYILGIAADLNKIASEDVARLPESIFKEVFLPLFAGEELKFPQESTIAGWISIAGSPYKEVDIFDTETHQVLFRCPPLFDYNGVNPVRNVKNRGERPIAEIVQMAEKLTNLHPNQGIAFLTQELSKRALTMNSGARLAPNVMRWNEVFKRYGRAPLVETAASAEQANASEHSGSGPEPDLTYEDF